MSTDLTTTNTPSTVLTLADEQTTWTSSQVAALQHMGVQDASPGDLEVFFHVVKRTGLDPFARQIYMIGRRQKDGDRWVTKQTIQTGIDGYRLIGRRAADRRGERISVSAPEWAHEDGSWRPVWSPKWGNPLAARVIVRRDGEEFPGVALFEEYKQTRRDGKLTSMWAQRPAGQIAKCAEALAWRMAFPQDLASVYVEDEMHQATNPEQTSTPNRRVTAAEFTTPTQQPPAAHDPVEPDKWETVTEPPAPTGPPPEPTPAPADDEPEPITAPQLKAIATLAGKLGLTRDQKLVGLSHYAGRPIDTSKALTKIEATWCIDAMKAKVDELPVEEPPADDTGAWEQTGPDLLDAADEGDGQ